jgi:protein tyrosine/serine phosphatase
MMQIKFIDRGTAKRNIENGAFALNQLDLISISDTWSEAQQMRELWLDNKIDTNAALFLKFADIDDNSSGFTDKDAERVVNFVQESFVKRKDVVVHCFAGISRSGAVAKFVNEYWGLGDEFLEAYAGHNRHIFYKLLEAAGVPTLRQYYSNLEDQNGRS